MRGSGLDVGPHGPNGSTRKYVMSLICIRLDQTKQTVSGCLAQFRHEATLAHLVAQRSQRRLRVRQQSQTTLAREQPAIDVLRAQ